MSMLNRGEIRTYKEVTQPKVYSTSVCRVQDPFQLASNDKKMLLAFLPTTANKFI
ncbi:MAG: hypothetical protein JWR72_3539 [Flavisolibacter sp.]|nr:hypothetical protein [Flavisolibacter sp.]